MLQAMMKDRVFDLRPGLITVTIETIKQFNGCEDLIEPLNINNIPNHKNLDAKYINQAFDPGNKYSLPYQWGTMGIGYNLKVTKGEINSWASIQQMRWNKRWPALTFVCAGELPVLQTNNTSKCIPSGQAQTAKTPVCYCRMKVTICCCIKMCHSAHLHTVQLLCRQLPLDMQCLDTAQLIHTLIF
jgi:hypothetical protein